MAQNSEKDRKPDVKQTTEPGRETDEDPTSPNPPRTTKGGMTAPKFGSAGSGGAELEPGPERD